MRLATHSGSFHADECTAVFIAQQVFEIGEIVRTRDQAVIDGCDIAVDVGAAYDPARLRFDHHQLSFNEKFDQHSVPPMSSVGQIYKSHGKQFLAKAAPEVADEELDFLHSFVYHQYVEALDANDNGVAAAEHIAFPAFTTGLPARIGRLNKTGTFEQAVQLCGRELLEYVGYVVAHVLCRAAAVRGAFATRFELHESGLAVRCDELPTELLQHCEREFGCRLLYVCGSKDGEHRILAVSEPQSYAPRRPLPAAWRGLRGADLERASGIPGGVFVHRSGFLGVWSSREGQDAALRALLAE